MIDELAKFGVETTELEDGLDPAEILSRSSSKAFACIVILLLSRRNVRGEDLV